MVTEKTGTETEARNVPVGGGPALPAEDPITFPELGEWVIRERTIQEQTDLFIPSPAVKRRGPFATLMFNAG